MKKHFELTPTAEWLNQMGNYTHALTINLKKRHSVHRVWINEDIAAQTAFRLVSHLGRYLFRRRHRKGYEKINAVVSLERGNQFDRWHLHAAIEKPIQYNSEEFRAAICHVTSKLDWCRKDIHIQEYESAGWMDYMLKNGNDSLVVLNTVH